MSLNFFEKCEKRIQASSQRIEHIPSTGSFSVNELRIYKDEIYFNYTPIPLTQDELDRLREQVELKYKEQLKLFEAEKLARNLKVLEDL